MFEKWSLRDVILLALLAILFGGIFVGSGFLYNILTAILAPAGLEPFANGSSYVSYAHSQSW